MPSVCPSTPALPANVETFSETKFKDAIKNAIVYWDIKSRGRGQPVAEREDAARQLEAAKNKYHELTGVKDT